MKFKITCNTWARCVVAVLAAGQFLAGAAAPPTDTLSLWLRGDAGVTVSGEAVSAWADQSGQGHDALQGTPANQPRLVTTGMGRSALRFDGVNDFLSFDVPINGLDGISIFLVANNASAAQTGGTAYSDSPAIFWSETASWGWVFLSPFQTNVNWRFGTTTTANNHRYPRPTSIGGAYSITSLVKNMDVETLYVDRAMALQVDFKNYPLAGVADAGYLGRGSSTYFNGEILEVLVYASALSDTDRQSVEAYLHDKYFSNQRPTIAITSPTAGTSFNSPASVTVTADATDDGSVSQVEFYANGVLIGTDTTAPFSVAWNNVTGGAYGLTAKATDNLGAWMTSERTVVQVNYATPQEGPVLNGLGLWFSADAGITSEAGKVSQWADRSGFERNAVQPVASAQPALVTSGRGLPAVSFDGLSSDLPFEMPMDDLSELSIVIVGNNTAPQTTGGAGEGAAAIFWTESASWGALSVGLFQNSANWRIGTTVPQSGSPNYPGPAYTRPASINRDYTSMAVIKNGSDEMLYVDGQLATTVSGKEPVTAGINAAGGHLGRGIMSGAASYFRGEILEVLVYTRALSEAEVANMETYLRAKYWSQSAPTVEITSPADATAFAAPGSITITAAASDTDGTIAKVEFFDSGVLIGTSGDAPYTMVLANAAPGAHTLTAKATDNAGLFRYSAPVFVFGNVAGGFARIDDFEARQIGPILYQGDWLGMFGGDRVVMDPTAFEGGNTNNKVLRLATANQSLAFPALIPEGQTGTLYFRAASTTWSRDDVSLGFSDKPSFGYASQNDYEVQVVRRTGNNLANKNIGVYDGTTLYSDIQPFLSDVWYKVWVVVDNAADTWQMYIQDASLAEPAPVTHDGTGVFSFRNGAAANDLVRFFLWTPQQSVSNGAGGGFWVDDIYLAMGTNLGEPVGAPAPALRIERSGNSITASWPASASGYSLEWASSLPATSWSAVSEQPTQVGDEMTVTIAAEGAAKFFRLKK